MSFVPSSGTKQKDEETRKLIRRHVMLGKNRGRTPRRPKQPTLEGTTVFSAQEPSSKSEGLNRPQPPVGSDIMHLNFADNFSETLQHETLRFCTTMTENMFTLSSCIAFDSRDDWAVCLQPLCCDQLYANAMVFGSQLYIDKSFQQTTSRSRTIKQSSKYYDKSLRLLRERLPDIHSHESTMVDAVILAIYTFAMHALLIGDLTAAKLHVSGLSSLTRKTSPESHILPRRTKQMIELFRCDLSISLATGQIPLLSSEIHQRRIEFPSRSMLARQPDLSGIYFIDGQLSDVWHTMSLFCAEINVASANSSQLSQDLLLEIISSTAYRAVGLSPISGSIDGTVRLALLAFCKLVFLDWPVLRLPLPWLAEQLNMTITNLMKQPRQDVGNRLLLWVVVMYALSHKSVPLSQDCRARSWLQEASYRCGLDDWAGAKRILSAFLWIDIVCDHKARRLLDDIIPARTVMTID